MVVAQREQLFHACKQELQHRHLVADRPSTMLGGVACCNLRPSDHNRRLTYIYYSIYNRLTLLSQLNETRFGMFDAEEGSMRLAKGVVAGDGSAEFGRLEVFHEGGWGTVCDNAFINRFEDTPLFSSGAAAVACRQLGYQRGSQIQKLVCPA